MDLIFSELKEDLLDWGWGSALIFDMLLAAADPLSGIITFLLDIDL